MKGRSEGVDPGGRVLDFPASGDLCGMENELFALVCLLKTRGSCVATWRGANHISFFKFYLVDNSLLP